MIMQPIKKQKGLGIIELMVAILISLFLMGGLLQMYISNKQTYRTQAGMARLQENARFVNHELNKEIRMAGSAGCSIFPSAASDVVNNFGAVRLPWDFSNGSFRGFEYDSSSWVPSLPTAYSQFAHADIDEDSDLLVIRRMSDVVGRLQSDYTANTTTMTVDISEGLRFAANDIVMINDCSTKVGLAQVVSVTTTTPPTSQTLTLSYVAPSSTTPGYKSVAGTEQVGIPANFPQGSVVGKLVFTAFYLSPTTPRKLIKTVLNKGPLEKQELVQGIDSLQFVYGEDTDADGIANYFYTANNVTTWANVVSVRASFTASTIETIDHNIEYTNASLSGALSDMDASEASALNGLILRHFSTLIALRNKELH